MTIEKYDTERVLGNILCIWSNLPMVINEVTAKTDIQCRKVLDEARHVKFSCVHTYITRNQLSEVAYGITDAINR